MKSPITISRSSFIKMYNENPVLFLWYWRVQNSIGERCAIRGITRRAMRRTVDPNILREVAQTMGFSEVLRGDEWQNPLPIPRYWNRILPINKNVNMTLPELLWSRPDILMNLWIKGWIELNILRLPVVTIKIRKRRTAWRWIDYYLKNNPHSIINTVLKHRIYNMLRWTEGGRIYREPLYTRENLEKLHLEI